MLDPCLWVLREGQRAGAGPRGVAPSLACPGGLGPAGPGAELGARGIPAPRTSLSSDKRAAYHQAQDDRKKARNPVLSGLRWVTAMDLFLRMGGMVGSAHLAWAPSRKPGPGAGF